MFNAIKTGFKKARDLFRPLFERTQTDAPTRNEMRLDSDEWAIKRKLGRSFFTKQLPLNTRRKRLATLTQNEWALALNRGWVNRNNDCARTDRLGGGTQ